MSKKVEYDIAIIGAGSGGLSLAAGAAQLGANVILFEKHLMGGDCLNYGCVPSKSLLSAAKSASQIKYAHQFGIYAEIEKIDFQAVMDHVKNVIDSLSSHDSIERFEQLGVKIIKEHAHFIDSNTLSAGSNQFKAKYFVIASGSSPFIPPIEGLENISYETNETIFQLKEQPNHLIVIGGGPIGCEMAQAFALLGCEVSLIEMNQLLPHDDPDCVQVVRESLLNCGVKLFEHCQVRRAVKNDTKQMAVYISDANGEQCVSGSHLLIATGRKPNIDGLSLERAKVECSPKGIIVDDRLRTSQKHIYAIGDVAGLYQFTHAANSHAGVVLKNILFWLPAKVNQQEMPWVTYTHPELAHIGASTHSVSTHDKVLQFSYADNDRAQTERITQGKIKVRANKNGQIKGVTIVGEKAGELLTPWILSIKEKRKLRHIADIIVPYPTLSEISKSVSSEFYKPKLFSTRVKQLVRILFKLGRR